MADETWTIRRVLQWTQGFFRDKGLDSPRLDAELIIGDALGLDRLHLYTDHDRPLDAQELAGIRERVRRRGRREPVAYITGKRGFWKLELQVGPGVLVPRPDTERLVECALEAAAAFATPRIVDVGTGSGCIALALAHDLPNATVLAIDRSVDALRIARANVEASGLGNVTCVEGDLLEPARGFEPDLIVSNPPYIAGRDLADLPPDVRDFEPRLALDGGPDGLAVIRRLVAQSGEVLRAGGRLLFEIGFDQGETAAAVVAADGRFVDVRVHRDYGGRDRVVDARRAH
ncbi:MAG: peptide chain release factor N(5)-glutamine methyltransferase [Bradymonadia bacterium]|jgi:release factor glutamine methyltransferase